MCEVQLLLNLFFFAVSSTKPLLINWTINRNKICILYFLFSKVFPFWNIFCVSVLLSRYLYSSRLGASPYYFYNCPHKLFQQWSNFHQILVLVTLARNVLLVCVRGWVTLYIFSTTVVRWTPIRGEYFFLNTWNMLFRPKFNEKRCFPENVLIIPFFYPLLLSFE